MIRLLALILTFSFTLSAATRQRERTSTFEPCSWWSYDTQTNSYSCRNPGFRVTVYTQSEVQALVQKLESRIQALESRLAIVEQKLP